MTAPSTQQEPIAYAMARAVGEVLGETRKAQHRKQIEVAATAGINVVTLSRTENGHRDVSLRDLFALCEALDVNAGDVVGRAERRVPVIGCRRPIYRIEEHHGH